MNRTVGSGILLVRSLLLLGAAMGAGGCMGGDPEVAPEAKSDYVYRLGPGDVIEIDVMGQEGLFQQATVTPDGFVTMRMNLEGESGGWSVPIRVMDLTILEVAQLVHEGMVKTLVEPIVTVRLLESRSARVHLVGEVGAQGAVPYLDRMTLVDALSQAGGINWTTARTGSVRVLRARMGEPRLYEVDFDDLLAAQARDFYLEPGDVVYVPSRWVTDLDRFIRQLLSPVSVIGGTATQAAGGAARAIP